MKELRSDPQLLAVAPRRFREHMEVIRREYEPVPLAQLLERRGTAQSRKPPIAITFDDGYADNLYNAKRILNDFDIPATVFVATAYLNGRSECWSCQLEQILLLPGRLPDTLFLDVPGRTVSASMASDTNYKAEDYTRNCSWTVESSGDPTSRHTLYRELCDLLRPLGPAMREEVLRAVWNWAGREPSVRGTHRFLTPDELCELTSDGSVVAGAHSVTHSMLSALSPEEQRREVAGSKKQLQEITGRSVRLFAYPFGGRAHYSKQTIDLVREAGFEAACSNFPGLVTPRTNRYELPRIIARNWDGEEFAHRLRRHA